MTIALEKNRKTQLLVLQAKHGDSMVVKTFDKDGNNFNVLIDGGTSTTYQETLKKELKHIAFIDIVVLTHIDADHIGGLIKFVKNVQFSPDNIGRYWFNSKNITFISNGENISYNLAISFEELLISKGELKNKWTDELIVGTELKLPEGIEIEIISPTEEILEKLYLGWPDLSEKFNRKLQDVSISAEKVSQVNRGTLEHLALADDSPEKDIMSDVFNSSSIAFIFRTFDMNILFLADSHPNLIENSLEVKGYSKENKLKVDFVKISHHGSKNNTTNKLLDMIDCDNFIISTNGGNSNHTHPDRETIARIIHHSERRSNDYAQHRKIYLNYKKQLVELRAGEFVNDTDMQSGNWELIEDVNLFEK